MSKITYLDDLVKELAQEHGLSEREALEICQLSIEYLHELMMKPNVVSIRIPFLGVMYLNYKRAKQRYKVTTTYTQRQPVLDKQLALIEELNTKHKKLAHMRKPILASFKRIFVRDHKKRVKTTKQELFKIMEEYQNGI